MPTATEERSDLESVQRLTRDIAAGAAGLSRTQARFLVDAYYTIQEHRIAVSNQVRATEGEPNETLRWLLDQMETLENQVKRALDKWTDGDPVGRWAKSITGIGPVICAGFMAHIDIEKALTVGDIWRFAGLDPTSKWEKGEKRPWNARLKVLCWKAGDSFVKQKGREADVYGKVYAERKAWELERNERGEYAATAGETLSTRKITDAATKACYEAGKLPLGRIELRARRYAVKLFLSAFHEVAFFAAKGTLPPKPYILTQPNHTHYFAPPNMHLIPGLAEAHASVT